MPLLLQIKICGSRQAALLGAADGCRRGSVIAVFSVANLNKNEVFIVPHDEVNLSHAAQKVACDQLESLRFQIIKRILLGPPASLPAAHPRTGF